jgi:hypothetical protein
MDALKAPLADVDASIAQVDARTRDHRRQKNVTTKAEAQAALGNSLASDLGDMRYRMPRDMTLERTAPVGHNIQENRMTLNLA